MVEETKVTGVSVPFLARVLHPIANRFLFAGGLAGPHTDRGRGLVTAKEGWLAGHHIWAGRSVPFRGISELTITLIVSHSLHYSALFSIHFFVSLWVFKEVWALNSTRGNSHYDSESSLCVAIRTFLVSLM